MATVQPFRPAAAATPQDPARAALAVAIADYETAHAAAEGRPDLGVGGEIPQPGCQVAAYGGQGLAGLPLALSGLSRHRPHGNAANWDRAGALEHDEAAGAGVGCSGGGDARDSGWWASR